MSYQIEPKSIVHECIDGEVVIVNFANGNYYSLMGVSAFIWEALIPGARTEDALCSVVQKSYQVDNETAKNDMKKFLAELVSEELLRVVKLEPALFLATAEANEIKKPYLAPTIEIHSDMQEVIVLDPVHEIEYAEFFDPTK